MNLPKDILNKIFEYIKPCVNDNQYYLVSKRWNKLIQSSICQPITAFGKNVCYYHHKKKPFR